MRRGVSLLEVLISMFVMLFGLMGVAAIFPVGNHYAGKADEFDRAAVLADQALAELKARGMLNSWAWVYAAPDLPLEDRSDREDAWHVIQQQSSPPPPSPGLFNATPTGGVGAGHIFVIDPLGAFGATHYRWPANSPESNPWAGLPTGSRETKLAIYGSDWPLRRVTFAGATTNKMPPAVAETAFRLRDDLAQESLERDDVPGQLRYSSDRATGAPLARQYAGVYSWFATITPATKFLAPAGSAESLQPKHELYHAAQQEVSVAVVSRRIIGDEFTLDCRLDGDDALTVLGAAANLDTAFKDFRDNGYIALVGPHPYRPQMILKWFRVIYFEKENSVNATGAFRRLTLEPTDWPTRLTDEPVPRPVYPVTELKAIVIPGVVSVATAMIEMQE